MKLGDMLLGIDAGRSFACERRPARIDEWAVIKVSAMTSGVFKPHEAKPLPSDVRPDPSHEIRAGDLLISRANTTAYVGASVIVPSVRPRLLLSDKSLRLRPHDEYDVRWLQFMLSSPVIRAQISAKASGTKDSMRNIGQQDLLDLQLPNVPLDEQHRTVASLEGNLSRLETASGYLAAAVGRAVGLVESVLRHGLLSGSDDVPLGELLSEPLANGRSVPNGHGARVLRLTALRSATVDVSASKAGAWTEDDAASFRIRQGDLLLARGNGSLNLVGRAAMVADDPPLVAFPDTMIRVRPDANIIDPRLLLALWNSQVVRQRIEAAARTTAGIYKINQRMLLDISVPLPSRDLQAGIVEVLISLGDEARRVAAAAEAAGRCSRSLREATLSAAFVGRL